MAWTALLHSILRSVQSGPKSLPDLRKARHGKGFRPLRSFATQPLGDDCTKLVQSSGGE